MIRAALICAALAAPAHADTYAQGVAVPSGRAVVFAEMIHEPGAPMGPTWRFRFVADGIGADSAASGFEGIAADMDFLCNAYAIPRLPARSGAGARIVVSLSAEPVEFGAARPEIAQFFEAYSTDGARCIWEGL